MNREPCIRNSLTMFGVSMLITGWLFATPKPVNRFLGFASHEHPSTGRLLKKLG